MDLEAPYVPSIEEAHQRLYGGMRWPVDEIIHRLLAIVLWESKRYNGREPVFATELPTGRPLVEGKLRQETWRAIFGEQKEPMPGAFVQCPTCRAWSVRHPDSNRSLNDDDTQAIADALKRKG